MKTKRFTIVLFLLFAISFIANDAQAFYNPQTGRWLSRDPIGDLAVVQQLQRQIKRDAKSALDNFQFDERAMLANTLHLYRFANNDSLSHIDPNGQWVIAVVAGGVAVTVAVIVLPDWDADSLSTAQANQVANLVAGLKKCANSKELGYLNAMTITGIFESRKPSGRNDESETRNGRFFGWGNRTILAADYFQRGDIESQLTTLLHESYHAGTEDWTEQFSYRYAEDTFKHMKCCLQQNGVLK